MSERTRRTLLGTVAAAGTAAVAGCSVSVGTPDLTVRNCLEESRPVSVTLTGPSEAVVHDDRHEVAPETCVDVKEAPVAVEDVVTDPGTYRVRADSPGVDPVEGTREFDRRTVEDDLGSTAVRLDEDGLEV